MQLDAHVDWTQLVSAVGAGPTLELQFDEHVAHESQVSNDDMQSWKHAVQSSELYSAEQHELATQSKQSAKLLSGSRSRNWQTVCPTGAVHCPVGPVIVQVPVQHWKSDVQLPFHEHWGAVVHDPFVHVPVQQSLASVHVPPFWVHVFAAHTPPVQMPEQHASSPVPPHAFPSPEHVGVRSWQTLSVQLALVEQQAVAPGVHAVHACEQPAAHVPFVHVSEQQSSSCAHVWPFAAHMTGGS
jgi:hypothetical protein